MIHPAVAIDLRDRYNRAATQADRDAALYLLGNRAQLFDPDEQTVLERADTLPPEARCRVLDWLLYSHNAELRDDLPPLLQVFTLAELSLFYQNAKPRYPDFELVMGLRAGAESLELSLHFQPLTTAPWPVPDSDFPVRCWWEPAALFWGEFDDGETLWENAFDFTLALYPDQQSFASEERFPAVYFEPDADPETESLLLIADLLKQEAA